jgi:4-amino-4-deoxy-L-arabinose transferase-like glycosyltransferase
LAQRTRLAAITAVLFVAAALRIIGLTTLPQGFRDEEIVQIEIGALARSGAIASFYNVDDPNGGREGLFGVMHGWLSLLFGKGQLPLRFFAVGCSLLSVALVYALGKRLFGHFSGLVAAIGMALTFYPIIVGRSITREALAVPLITLALLVMAGAVHLRHHIQPALPQAALYASLGALIALTAYAHWIGLLLVPLFGAFIVYLLVTRQPISRRVVSYSLFSALIALIVAIPYLGATVRTFPLSSLNTLWSNRPERLEEFLSGIWQAVGGIGIYGDMLPQQNLPTMPLLNPIGFVLLLIGVIEALRRFRRAPNYVLPLLALLLGLLADAWTRGALNFSHQLLALPAIMLLMGAGAATIANVFRASLPRATADRLIVFGTFAIAAATCFATSDLLFRVWANRSDVQSVYRARLGHLAAYLDRTYDGLSTSICTFSLDMRAAAQNAEHRFAARPDPQLLGLMLHRHDLALRYSNCLDALVLTDGGETQRYAFAHSTARSRIAEPLKAWLQNAADVPVANLPSGSVLRVDAAQIVADDFGQVILSQVWWSPEDSRANAEPAALPLRMGGYLTFEGYRLLPEAERYRAGDLLRLVTYWRADGEQVPGLRLFAHVSRNPDIPPALQNDVLNIESSLLRDRDVFIQIIDLPLPPDFPSGDYFLSIGAYSERDGQRLPIYDGETPRGDRLFLRKIRVE